MLVRSGIVIIAAGFLLRFNPLLVVLVSALATGLAARMGPLALLAAFGKAFNDSRYVAATVNIALLCWLRFRRWLFLPYCRHPERESA